MNSGIAGLFARLPNGQRVFVEAVGSAQGNLPARAIVRYIEGENKNKQGHCWVHWLKVLGPEIPMKDEG
jgi:hypothetical protein